MDENSTPESEECSSETEVTHGNMGTPSGDGIQRKPGKKPPTDRPNDQPLWGNRPPSVRKWQLPDAKKRRKRPTVPEVHAPRAETPEVELSRDGNQKPWGWRPEVPHGHSRPQALDRPESVGSEPAAGLFYYPVTRPQRTYGRRQAQAQIRPLGASCQLAPAPPMDRYAGLRPEPAMANGYYTVRQPARTYERRREANLVLHQDDITRSLDLCPDRSTYVQQGAPIPGQDFNGPRELIPRHPMGFKARAKVEFSSVGPEMPKSREPPQELGQSAQADFRAATTSYLGSQLDRVKQDAKNGDEGAFLLLEQIQAFGKHRHQFSKKTLMMCARWKDRSFHSYNCARGTQLFALPTAVTLTKHCTQQGLSS